MLFARIITMIKRILKVIIKVRWTKDNILLGKIAKKNLYKKTYQINKEIKWIIS
jgi:hypothetical protein